jgi:hypothetical protein
LKGLWTDWEPSDAQYSLWVRRLLRFQFNKAKDALEKWFCEANRTYKSPPINNILKYLSAKKAYDSSRAQPEAVKVFELYDQENPKRRTSFFESSLEALKRRDPYEIEQEAQRKRIALNVMYSSNFVLIMDWKQYFDEGSLL